LVPTSQLLDRSGRRLELTFMVKAETPSKMLGERSAFE